MRIIHVIYNDWTKGQTKILHSYGFSVETGFSRVDIPENEKNTTLLELIGQWGVERSVGTIYDKEDFIDSSLFVYTGLWSNGYPQPEDDFGYIDLTYNTENYCRECGTGGIQKAPFRLEKKPKWGNKVMFGLNWVFDEVFVKKDFYESFFKKFGLDSREVRLYKKDELIDDVVQLKIPVITIPLSLENQPYQTCKACHRKKFNPQIKGMFPGFSQSVPDLHMFKCSEYFGDGMKAFNRIFISKQLRTELEKLRIKPGLWPVSTGITP